MEFDAIVLAGGRGSRAGGVAKVLGTVGGATLLGRALDAGVGARRIVVVGPPELASHLGGATLVREDPPFGGPVAAIAAGCAALADPAEWTLVLAADHVDPAAAAAAVLESAAEDGAIAVDDERMQYLLAVYRSASLRAALAALPAVDGASVRALTSGLHLHPAAVPPGAARDIDTPDDAAAAGVTLPREQNGTMSTDDETAATLDAWWAALSTELGLADVPVDRDTLLSLAGVAAHSVVRPAAPLTTFLVGYAAGLAGGGADALARAAAAAEALARKQRDSAAPSAN